MASNAIHDDETILKIIGKCEDMTADGYERQMSWSHGSMQLFEIFFDILGELGWLKQSHMVLLNQWDKVETKMKELEDIVYELEIKVDSHDRALKTLKVDMRGMIYRVRDDEVYPE